MILNRVLEFFGFSAKKNIINLTGIRFYIHDYKLLKAQLKKGNSAFKFGKFYPILNERFAKAGIMAGHYFHQDLYVAKKIYLNQPNKHLDIGSRIDGFVAHVAVFREIDLIDIRPQDSKIKNIKFRQADLMKLPEDLYNSYDSISSLHAIEHFGLGRYGDPIDHLGYQKAIINISNILTQGGKFYFSVPIGPQRIEFNAHRIFSVNFLFNLLSHYYIIDNFSYVDDSGNFHENIELNSDFASKDFGCIYGCGIFELTKK